MTQQAKTPASVFLKSLSKLDEQNLKNIKGIGSVLAENFTDFLQSERYTKLISDFERLEQKGMGLLIDPVTMVKSSRQSQVDLPLGGKTVCITGSFDDPREEIKAKLELLGAKVTGSVTKSTDYLLAGDKAGSKLEKAQKLGVQIVESLEALTDVTK